MLNSFYSLFKSMITDFKKVNDKNHFEEIMVNENLKEQRKQDFNSMVGVLNNTFYENADLYVYNFKTIENSNDDNEILLCFHNDRLVHAIIQLFYRHEVDAINNVDPIIQLLKEVSKVEYNYEESKSYKAWRTKENLDFRVSQNYNTIAIYIFDVDNFRI